MFMFNRYFLSLDVYYLSLLLIANVDINLKDTNISFLKSIFFFGGEFIFRIETIFIFHNYYRFCFIKIFFEINFRFISLLKIYPFLIYKNKKNIKTFLFS